MSLMENSLSNTYHRKQVEKYGYGLAISINAKMNTLITFQKDAPSEIMMDLKWKPNGKEINFVYNNTLYAIPVE